MRTTLLCVIVLVALVLGGPVAAPQEKAAPAPATEPHRSPIDLALLADGRRALTANHTADSLSLIDLAAGKVLAEQPCGRKPAGVACSRDGQLAAVSNLWSGTIGLFAVRASALKPLGQVAVGAFPRGLVFAPDGQRLYAVVAGAEEVVEIGCGSRKVTHRWPAAREPRQLALSSDGRWLAAISTRSGQVRVWDTHSRRLQLERTIEDGFNLRGLAFTPHDQSLICTHCVRREFPVSKENIEAGWVIDSRLSRFALHADARPNSWQVALDTRGLAVGDPHGAAFSPDGRLVAVSAAGTHELLLLDRAGLPWNAGDPGDFIDPRLAASERRVPLGGRPVAVAFAKASGHAVVANYLLDAVQVVDTGTAKIVRTIALGSPAQPSLARRGEAVFYDAERSFHHWFSCNTCHTEGHTCGLNFDTLNDDSYGNPKLTPTLRNVAKTGPWTWHGWQNDLSAAAEKSLNETMFCPDPRDGEVKALVAFLESLEHPPHPSAELNPAAQRGQSLFEGKAACEHCHKGENYTSPSTYDVKLEPDGSPYKKWNPPSLRGVYDRGPYLHDGRARTLEEVLTTHHRPEQVGGEALTPDERQDVIAFLKSL